MTPQQARQLTYGDDIHEDDCILNVGKRGGVQTRVTVWRVNGRVRIWKTFPDRLEIPCKHGMREHYTFGERDLAHLHLPADCPLAGLETRHADGLESDR